MILLQVNPLNMVVIFWNMLFSSNYNMLPFQNLVTNDLNNYNFI